MLRVPARKYSKFRILARVYPGYELKVPTLVGTLVTRKQHLYGMKTEQSQELGAKISIERN